MSAQQKPKEKPKCYQCGQEVTFDKNIKDEFGTLIRLKPHTKEPHVCGEPIGVSEASDTSLSEAANQKGIMVTSEIKEKPKEYPIESMSIVRLFEFANIRDLEGRVNAYVYQARKWGANVLGQTYHKDDQHSLYSIAVFANFPTELAARAALEI